MTAIRRGASSAVGAGEGREAMSNRTNIDLEPLYCSTARRESIRLSEDTTAVSRHSLEK